MVSLGLAAGLGLLPAAEAPAPADPGSAALVRYREVMEELWASLDFTALDPKALQMELGTSPEAIARHVREKVRFETYPGILRGARGTLLAGAGNSWDRALLLHELLRLAGHRARFAWATLTAEKAESLVRAGRGMPGPEEVLSPELDRILARAEGHYFLLGDALHAAGHRFGQSDRKAWEKAVGEARDHAWVEIETGGAWKDVDPSPGVPFGSALAAAEGTGDSPGEEKFHRVEIVIEVEVSGAGGMVAEEVLRHGAHTASLAGVPVGLIQDSSGASVTPILLVGRSEIRGKPFEAAREPDGDGAFGLGGGLGRIAGTAPPGIVAGEWLRISFDGPSGSHEAVYTIADKVGPAARAARLPVKTPLAGAEELSGIFLGMSFAGGGVSPLLPWALLAETENPLDPRGLTRLLALRSLLYFVLRPALAAAHLGTRANWYLDGTNVVVARAETTRDGIALALVRKAYRIVRTPEDPAGTSSFHDYLASGALDHTLERALVGSEREHSLGSLIETACEEEVPLGILPPGAGRDLDVLSPDGRHFAAAAWKEGKVLAMPSRRPKGVEGDLGWWEVDLASGFTVDTLESGGHQANTEYGSQQKDTGPKMKAACLLAARVVSIGIWMAATGLAGTPVGDVAKIIKEMGLDDVIDDLAQGTCGGPRGPPPPGWNPMPPGWSPFPKSPKNFPNRSPNPFKNPPATRWPPGAPRGR